MQFLIFHIGGDRYGLDTRSLVRLLPLLELKRIPQAPDYIAGLMNLHGRPVPVVDLCRLAGGGDCAAHFDTRILLVDYRAGDAVLPLGLIAERVSGVQDIEPEALAEPGVAGAPWLGRVSAGNEGMLQLLDIDMLLPEQVRAMLYPEAAP